MSKGLEELPYVDASQLDSAFWSGEGSSIMARLAQEYGPIFRWTAREESYASTLRVSMVGPDANRFVMNTHRDHFSHDQGWTPFVGDVFGHGLLNMDDPEHARHRRM